jgi:hypothetical protein
MFQMRRYLYIIFISIFAILQVGCGAVDMENYEQTAYKFDFKEFFKGRTIAHGIVFNFTGTAVEFITIEMEGVVNGNVLELHETVTRGNGEKEARNWKIEFSEDGSYIGNAEDVIGVAKGVQKGNSAHSYYTLRIKRDQNRTIDLNMNDWIFQVSKDTVINRTTFYKFGFSVGELILTIKKL